MSFVIPLGLDASKFEKELKSTKDKIFELTGVLESLTTKVAEAPSKTAMGLTKGMQGSVEELKEQLKSLEIFASKIDLAKPDAKKNLVDITNQYMKMRGTIEDTGFTLEKLYKLQQEYIQLNKELRMFKSKDFTFTDKTNSPETLKKRVLALREEKKAREEAAREAERQAKAQAKQEKAEKEYANAQKVADSALKMSARTVKDYENRINALKNAQSQLNLETNAGRAMHKRLDSEIVRNQKSIDRIQQRMSNFQSTLSNVAKKMAAIFSIHAIKNFTMKIITIGGEFEKMRVALGSIIKDVSQANILFSQLKTQALESPFTFRQLVAGTRELSAYNIAAKDLYKTQFMLTELSSGLGVEMSRLVLAYGQVKSAAVLRGQELRQFTEAGIPIIQALADKFSVLEGRVVSAGDVFERVSNRMVSFQMVHEVLADMTEEGGKFFQMQEKQAATLAGQWNNVKDAVEMMFYDISKSGEGSLIKIIVKMKELIVNWRYVATGIKVAGAALGVYAGISAIYWFALKRDAKIANALLIKKNTLLAISRGLMAGLITVGVAGLTYLIGKWIESSKEMKHFAESMEDIHRNLAVEYNTEAKRLKNLIGQLKNATEGSKNFLDIKEKLTTQYGQYFPKLISEYESVEDIANAYDNATEKMRAFYGEKAMEEAKAKLNEDKGIKKIKEKIANDLEDFFSVLGVASTDRISIRNTIMKDVEEATLKNDKEYFSKFFEKTSDVFKKYGKQIDPSYYAERIAVLSKEITRLTGSLSEIETKEEQYQISEEINALKKEYQYYKGLNLKPYFNSLNQHVNEYYNNFKKKTEIIHDLNVGMFGEMPEMIIHQIDEIKKAYDLLISNYKGKKIELNTELGIKTTTLDEQKFVADKLVRKVQDIINAYMDAGKEMPEIDFLKIFNLEKGLVSKEDFVEIFKDMKGVVDKDGKAVLDSLYNSFLSTAQVARKEYKTDLQYLIGSFFEEEKNLIKANAIWEVDVKERKDKQLDAVRNITKEIISLNDATEKLIGARDNKAEQIAQLEANIKAQEEKLRSGEYGGDTKANIEAQLEKSENDLAAAKDNLEITNKLIKWIGISEKEKKGAGGRNLEHEWIMKVIKLYEEARKGYDDYNKTLTKTIAIETVRNETLEEFNKLNREKGGVLGETMPAITDDASMNAALNDLIQKNFLKTQTAKSALEKQYIKYLSGLKAAELMQEFQAYKETAESIMSNVVIGFNVKDTKDTLMEAMTETAKTLLGKDDIIFNEDYFKKMETELPEKYVELFKTIFKEIKENTKKQEIFDVKAQVDKIKEGWKIGKDVESLGVDFGINALKGYFKDITDNFDTYIVKLKEQQKKLQDIAPKEAADLGLFIQSEELEYAKNLYVEVAKNAYNLSLAEAKVESLLGTIERRNEYIVALKENQEDLDEELASLYEQGLNITDDSVIALLEKIGLVEKQIELQKQLNELTGVEIDKLSSESFRASQMYMQLFNDADEYSKRIQKSLLDYYKEALVAAEGSKIVGAGRHGEDLYKVQYTKRDEKGNIVYKDDGVTPQMVTVTMTAKEYNKTLDDINKKQRKLTEGNPIRKLAEQWKKVKQVNPTTGEKEFSLKDFGEAMSGTLQLASGLAEAASSISELSFMGMSGETGDWFGMAAEGMGAIATLASNPYDIGAWIQLGSTIVKMADYNNVQRIAQLTKEFEALNKTAERANKELDKLSDLASIENAYKKIFALYEDKMNNLKERLAASEKMVKQDDAAKKEQEALRKEIDEHADAWEDKLKEMQDRVIEDAKSAAESFADAWVEAFLSGEDAMDVFDKSFDDLMKSLLKKQIAGKYMSVALAPFFNTLENLTKDGSLIFSKKDIQDLKDSKDESMRNLQALLPYLQELFESFGISLDEFKGDTLQKGIQSITESTAQVIASYMNSVRLEVITIRTLMERGDTSGSSINNMHEMKNLMNKFYPLYLEQMIAINENTEVLKSVYDNGKNALRIV